MQRTPTLDLCFVLEGEITLVLDSGEVALKEGDTAIVNGARHAWSNRSDAPAIVIVSQHSGIEAQASAPPAADGAGPSAASEGRTKFRRVVAGQDQQGRSCVIADAGTPNVFRRPTGSWFYEMWTLDEMPAPLLGNIDRGCAGRTVMHSPPPAGANWRIAFSPADDAPAGVSKDARAAALDSSGGTERRPGGSMHRTPSVDYAICVEGERTLVLEDSEVVLRKGDVVIQLGNWHTWATHFPGPSMMSYVMIGGEFG
jgi:quercetin dioxygenase-like cupin family protein